MLEGVVAQSPGCALLENETVIVRVYGHEGEVDNTSWAPIGEGMDAGDPELTTGHNDPRLPTLSGG